MTDIIERAEQWLKALPKADVTDAAELIEELVDAYKELCEGCAEATRVSAIVETELLETIEEYRQTVETFEITYKFNKDGTMSIKLPPPGINEAWPGNPGEGD